MIYWSSHPICGDLPMNYKDEITKFAISCLIDDVEMELSTNTKNEKISDELMEIVLKNKLDLDEIESSIYQQELNTTFEKDLWNTYKYEIIHQYLDDEMSFVVPFYFIVFDVRINKKYMKYLMSMLKDGNASNRNYGEWESEHDHPMYFVHLAEKYQEQLFNEDNDELDENFVKEHPEIQDVYPATLMESVLLL